MKIAFPISILLAHCLSNSCGEKISVLPEARTEVSEEVAFEKLLDIEMNIKNGVEYIIKSALPFVIRQGDDFQLSVGCVAALMKTMFALRDMKLWPFEMLDATGKPGAGMLSGTLSHLGSYHQCLRVKIPDSSHGKLPPQTGQYCMIMLRPPLPPKPKPLLIFKSVFQRNNATFNTELMREINKLLFGAYVTGAKYGVCIPSACSQEDLGVMVDSAASMLGVYIEIDGCEVPEPFQMDFVQKLVSGILLSIVLVCLVVTLISEIQKHCLDESRRDQKKTYKQLILEALSIVDNFRKLMKTKPVKKHSLNSMNGLRFLSMTWVVLGHSYCLIPKNFAREPIHMLKSREDFFFTAIAGAFMSVESFVFITGTLLSYHLVTYFDQSRTYKPILVIVHRVWRFWPSIALMTGLMILTPLVGSGPDYKQIMEDQADMCRKHWWRNFVFINNWHQINKQCLAHFWYLAVDMQCFLVGLLYFFVLFKKSLYGMVFLGFTTFACVFSTGLTTYLKKFPPGTVLTQVDIQFFFEYGSYIYVKPHVHLGIYAVGLFLGTYLARNKKATLSKCYSIMGWITATCIGITVVYAVYPWNNDVPYSMVEAIMFSATQRTVWGICLAWVVFACYVGKGGYVNELLSWPGFQPLVKVSFLVYVTHPVVFGIYGLTRLGNQDFTNSQFVWNFFALLITSHILAVFLRLFYEAPCIELERVFCSWFMSGTEGKSKKAIEEPPMDEKYTESRRYSVNGQLGVDNEVLKIDL